VTDDEATDTIASLAADWLRFIAHWLGPFSPLGPQLAGCIGGTIFMAAIIAFVLAFG
jgi:hypothetical protein